MKLSDLVTLVRNFLGDAASVSNTWDDSTIYKSATFACKEYVKKTRATRKHTDLLPTTECELNAPSDWLDIIHIVYPKTAGKELVKTSHDFESLKNPLWETDTAALPKRWCHFGGNVLKIVPLALPFVPVSPASMTAGNDYTISAVGNTDWVGIGATGAVANVSFVAGGGTVGATACLTGKYYQVSVVGNTDWSAIGATGSVTGAEFTATGAGSGTGVASAYVGTGLAWPNASVPYVSVEYVQTPTPLSTKDSVLATALISGTTYEIATVGDTTWTTVGATGTTGECFVATGSASSTTGPGTAYEAIDQRIPEGYQEYLKYAMAHYLLRMQGDRESIEKGDKYLSDFNAQIGPIRLV